MTVEDRTLKDSQTPQPARRRAHLKGKRNFQVYIPVLIMVGWM